MERRLNVKMKRSKKRCRLGVAIPDRLFIGFLSAFFLALSSSKVQGFVVILYIIRFMKEVRF